MTFEASAIPLFHLTRQADACRKKMEYRVPDCVRASTKFI